MPYILSEDRKKLDPLIGKEIDRVVFASKVDVGNYIRKVTRTLAKDVYSLLNSNIVVEGPSRLAIAIAEDKDKALGNLHYTLARILTIVPKRLKMKQGYATQMLLTGPVARVALVLAADLPHDSLADGLVSTIIDVVLEYKRRINAPYEDIKCKENGEVYDIPKVKAPTKPKTKKTAKKKGGDGSANVTAEEEKRSE